MERARSMLGHARYSARVHSAEDIRVERDSQKNELDYDGKSQKYARTCEITEDILGWGDNDNRLHYKQVSYCI